VKYFLLSAPVDWQPDQLIRRFLLPTGDYVSCVLWLVPSADDTEPTREADR
jgi:transcription factor STE12